MFFWIQNVILIKILINILYITQNIKNYHLFLIKKFDLLLQICDQSENNKDFDFTSFYKKKYLNLYEELN